MNKLGFHNNSSLRSLRLCERQKLITLVRFVILGFLIPVTLSFVVYAGFNTVYTSQGLTLPGFMEQYFNGVYRYRILGRSLLLETYNLVKAWGLPLLQTSSGDPQLYAAYFYLNTFFLCLTCSTLFFVLKHDKKNQPILVDLPLLFLCALMALSQFVVVPYDTLSYFLLALSAWLIVKNLKSIWALLGLGLVVVLATLTRESALLIPAFYLAVNHKSILVKPTGKKLHPEQLTLLALAGCFGLTYLTLRLILGFSQSAFQNLTLIGNSNLLSVMGLLFMFGVTFLLLSHSTHARSGFWFFVASLPYLLPLLLVAVWWELRLWVPFLMLLLVLVLQNEKDIPQSVD